MKVSALVVVLIWIVGVIGWILNIYKLVSGNLAILEWTTMEIIRIVGIFFPPLGAILGYL